MSCVATLALIAWTFLAAQTAAAPVVVHAWVENDRWPPAADLQPDDFEVLVDREPVPLQSLAPRRSGAAIVLVLDATRSTSWSPRPLDEQLGLFAASLAPDDRLLLATIGATVEFSRFRPASHDIRNEVRQAVARGAEEGAGSSPIWDAIHRSVTILALEPAPRIILLVSDGRATGNRYGLVETADYAMAHGVTIHIVISNASQRIRQTADTAAVIQPGAPLEGLAAYTGGVLFFYPQFQEEQARARFTQIAEIVRALHAFTFTPPKRDGQPHRLEIRSRRPGVKVHAPLAFLTR